MDDVFEEFGHVGDSDTVFVVEDDVEDFGCEDFAANEEVDFWFLEGEFEFGLFDFFDIFVVFDEVDVEF